MNDKRFKKRTLFLIAYLVFALLPIYWMLNMSFKTNQEILSSFTLWPTEFTWANYRTIFTDPSWYSGYINSLIYVGINTVISLTVALPAAYAFSRYRFLGDKHVFFWLLTNRMTPPAVFLLPFFQLYTTLGLMDTHIAVAMAHLLFNVPLAVWILEGFMSGIPQLSALLLHHLPAADQGRRGRGGVLLLHVQLGRAAAGAHAHQRQRQTHRGHHDAHRERQWHGLGDPGGGGRAHHRAGCHRDLVCAALHREGIRDGPCLRSFSMFQWMVWTTPVAVFFTCIVLMLIGMTVWEIKSPTIERKGFLPMVTTRGDRLFIGLLGAAYINLAFIGLAGWLTQWLSLEQEPSIWISFVASMAWLVLALRKG